MDEQKQPEPPAAIRMAQAANRIDLLSPEFIIALLIVIAFNIALFIFRSEDLRGALIGQFGVAVGYYLGQDRGRRQVGPTDGA